MRFALLAILICLVAIAYVSAAPVDEQIVSDNVDALSPADDNEFHPKLIKKKLIILKVKALKKILGK